MSVTVKKAIEGFLLTCKVEGKSYGTIECYTDKLKGFHWYVRNYDVPDDVTRITTQNLREFLAYLRESKHRFNSTCPRTRKPINNTTIQKYYRALSVLFKWLISEGELETNPLEKIKVPKAERKVVKSLSYTEVNQLLSALGDSFEGVRNKAIIMVLIDCGLRLGELLNISMADMSQEAQLIKVDGKTGERVVRYGNNTAKALQDYLDLRVSVNGHIDNLWLTDKGNALKHSSVETLFIKLKKKTGLPVHPHLLRHTFATLWLRNGGDSLMLQRLLGHTTLMMTNRYCQAVGCSEAVEAHRKYSPMDKI